MAINLTFSLGQGSSKISHRAVKILNVAVNPNVAVYDQNLAGTTEEVTVELAENGLFQLILRDYITGGITLAPTSFNFSTNIAGLVGFPSGGVRIIGVEETSSSSSSSLSSVSSTSSVSSSSTSSASSSSSTSSRSELSSSSSSPSSSSSSSLSSTSTSSLSSSSTSSSSSSSKSSSSSSSLSSSSSSSG